MDVKAKRARRGDMPLWSAATESPHSKKLAALQGNDKSLIIIGRAVGASPVNNLPLFWLLRCGWLSRIVLRLSSAACRLPSDSDSVKP
jgi:hypothetical protein